MSGGFADGTTSPGWAAPAYDVLVIGAGLAGLTAAARLAEDGAKVMLIAKGVGATHLAPGTIDVLGYAPERVERPGEALGGLDYGHPYTRVGAHGVAAAIEWFKRQFDGGPLGAYGYAGDLRENVLLPTTVGAAKPSAVVPRTMAAGDLRDAGPMLVVGFRALRDFLQERWKGVWPILYGDQLRQARLDDWIFQGLLDVEHLPS